MNDLSFSTGIDALDEVLHGILPGDNIVFQVDSITDYIPFVRAFCKDNEKNNRRLIYFRFAEHEPLIPKEIKAEIFTIHPEDGFEHFIDEIFNVIERFGRGACYVFDSLSDLAVDWYSDRMVANFFMLTCPYLYDFETGTYFALLRNKHSQYTISKIHETAQIILDIYKKNGKFYLHPLKVWNRHSPTMYNLHIWQEKNFIPVLKSAENSEILTEYAQPWVDFTTKIQDIWSKTFNEAHKILEDFTAGVEDLQIIEFLKEKLIRMALTRDPKLFKLVNKYLNLKDLIDIGRRMIGTGLIGGKSLGMLLAQAILIKTNPNWNEKLEKHDSFFIGSDVFYAYLVINKCWWERYKIRKSDNFHELASKAREIIENGVFPDDIIEQFKNILNYYGQSPIIVRSSSILEDAYGNAFSGKYDSVFLANQGTPEERLEEFINGVRTVYKSTLSEEALNYRLMRDLLDEDEQMAILVQRVSGSKYGDLFYPQLAGVGYSYNPYLWNKDIKPKDGMIRLVFGLGTRAVDRFDDDYTRIVALSAPERRPEATEYDRRRYNQRKVDVLNLKTNSFNTLYFDEVIDKSPNLQMEMFGRRDYEIEQQLKQRCRNKTIYSLDLDKIIMERSIITDMKELLQTLEDIYDYPIDIEFTINIIDDDNYKIYVLQCRPFQVRSEFDKVEEPKNILQEDIIMKTEGPIVGNGVAKTVDRLIYVVPDLYGELPIQDRFKIARLIGEINQTQDRSDKKIYFLAGPGRWATLDPSLGIPINVHEISTITIICEIAEMHKNLFPDVSLGTHFFNDLVENDMLYVAIDPRKKESILNKQKLLGYKNQLPNLISNVEEYEDIIKVIEVPAGSKDKKIKFYADPVNQVAILYLE